MLLFNKLDFSQNVFSTKLSTDNIFKLDSGLLVIKSSSYFDQPLFNLNSNMDDIIIDSSKYSCDNYIPNYFIPNNLDNYINSDNYTNDNYTNDNNNNTNDNNTNVNNTNYTNVNNNYTNVNNNYTNDNNNYTNSDNNTNVNNTNSDNYTNNDIIISNDIINNILSDLKSGLSVTKLTNKYHLSREKILQISSRTKKVSDSCWTDVEIKKLIQEYHKGESILHIAKTLNKTATKIAFKLLNLGYKV